MRVLIVGGGVIGLSIGWQLVRSGFDVQLFERGFVGQEASFTAAGLLCPLSEAFFENREWLAQGIESLRLYPQFLQELREDAKGELSLESRGALLIGLDRDDAAHFEHLCKTFPLEWISISKARAIEPLLSPRIACSLWLPEETHIDNRQLLKHLAAAFQNRGGLLVEQCAALKLWEENGTLRGLETERGLIGGDLVINAAGAWAAQISKNTIRPNKGQILTLRMEKEFPLSHIIRTPRVYLAPKRNGTIRIGATSEEMGFDKRKSAGAILTLLQAAFEAIPAVESMEWIETTASFRPVSRDLLPLIREGTLSGYFEAIGHGRSGILLAPYTAALLKEALCKFA